MPEEDDDQNDHSQVKQRVEKVPTVTMNGPAGNIICNKTPQDMAFWRNRGYTLVRSNQDHDLILVEEQVEPATIDTTEPAAEEPAAEEPAAEEPAAE